MPKPDCWIYLRGFVCDALSVCDDAEGTDEGQDDGSDKTDLGMRLDGVLFGAIGE